MSMRCLGCMKEYDDSLDVCPFCGYEQNTPAKKSNHLAPGTMLAGRYIIGRALGSGGFGITYIAWDCQNRKSAAIKEYIPGVFAYRVPGQNNVACYNQESAEKFKAGIAKTIEESNCLARFNSVDGVVDVYNCIEENDTVYIIMEYLEGKTLKEILLERGQFTFSEALDTLVPILEALSKIHETGVIHRDISPDNIFICNSGKVKLIDFGAARAAIGDDQKSLSIILKRGYAPKEQYSGHSKQGPWTDVYATAATMYRMLTGTVPQESLERDISDALIPPSEMGVEIPKYAERAILRSLALRPSARTQSAGEFLRQLTDPNADFENTPTQEIPPNKNGVQGEATTVMPNGKGEPAHNDKEKHNKSKARIFAAVIAAVFLIAAGIVAAVTLSGKGEVLDSGTCGEKLTWKFDSNGLIQIDGSGEMDDYTNITNVPWYSHAADIKKVKLHRGVESIGSRAFYACPAISEIEVCDTLKAINEYAFFGCSDLVGVVLPDSLTSLGSYAFASCSSLKYLHIPKSVTSFGVGIVSKTGARICSDALDSDAHAYAQGNAIIFIPCDADHSSFEDTAQLTSGDSTAAEAFVVENGVCGTALTWVLDSAGVLTVSGTGAMTSTWILNENEASTSSPTWVDGFAPDWAAISGSVKTVIVEEGVTDIGTAAFAGFSALTSAVLPETLTAIGADAFNACRALTEITLGSAVKSIGNWAFMNCTSLGSIALPQGMTEISAGTFSGCTALSEITLPSSLTKISKYAFAECKRLISISIPYGVTELGEYAFDNCSSLADISLPHSITELSTSVFSGCGFTSFEIPSSIEIIGNYAFSGCKSLKNVEIPNSVAAIGTGAFGNCPSLTSVVLPSSVTTVGAYAFSDCSGLSYVHIPAGTKTIGADILEDSPAVICSDSLLSFAASYALKNGITFERCTGRH